VLKGTPSMSKSRRNNGGIVTLGVVIWAIGGSVIGAVLNQWLHKDWITITGIILFAAIVGIACYFIIRDN
jgi:hypothetical protein